MVKTITKKSDEIHFGDVAPEGFESIEKQELDNTLENLGDMKLWRCTVCNDLHIGIGFPKDCPTCHTLDAYVEVDLEEFKKIVAV